MDILLDSFISAIYENIFSGSVRTDGDGNTYCLIHDKVRLVVRTDRTGYVKISVNPKMIKVFPAQDRTFRRLQICWPGNTAH